MGWKDVNKRNAIFQAVEALKSRLVAGFSWAILEYFW
jgi:apolipoprotein N-acyltransferase